MNDLQRLAERWRRINPQQVKKKAHFSVGVMILGLVIVGADLWVIAKGLVITEPGRLLTVFILLCGGALLIAGLFALVALLVSARAYRRLAQPYPPSDTERE